MSLGVKSIWRVPTGVRRLSLIPRARLPAVSKPVAPSQLIRLLSSQRLARRRNTTGTASSDDGNPSSSKSVVAPVTLVDRLTHLPVRQHGARESVLVEPRIEYPHRRETRQSERRNHQGVTAQLRLDRIREAQHVPPPNWRAVLHALTVWTPKYSQDTVEVVLPEDAADLLQSDAEENIWDIQSRTGVTMELESRAGEDGPRSLLLSGDRHAIETAVEDILNVTKKVTRVKLPGETKPVPSSGSSSPSGVQETEPPPPVPIWETRTPPRRPYTLKTRAEDIPRPSTWTRTSVEEYVAALTMSRVPPTLASSIYPKGVSHSEVVIMQLHQIFNDPSAHQVLSTSAFKQALGFMAQKGLTFRPHARALFVRMEMLGLRMDTEVFNLLAESSVKARDLRSFSTTVNLMVKRGHRPNLRTWVLFLRLIKSEEVKRYILHSMNQTGLLSSPAAVKEIAAEMASHDIDRAIQQGKDLTTFLADQDTLYGPAWLSQSAANKVLETLGRHGRFSECGAFLDVMARSASARPDVVALNTVLTHCKAQNNLHEAVSVLELFEAKTRHNDVVVPDVTTYHLLSELGWRHKMPHVAGLVWRYACLVNKTSYRMRVRAGKLLRKSTTAAAATTEPAQNLSDAEQAPPNPAAAAAAASRPATDVETLFISEVTSDAAPGTSMQQMLEWYRQRHDDYEPAAPLGALLREALERDVQLRRDLKEGRPAAVRPVALPTRRRRRTTVGGGGGVGLRRWRNGEWVSGE